MKKLTLSIIALLVVSASFFAFKVQEAKEFVYVEITETAYIGDSHSHIFISYPDKYEEFPLKKLSISKSSVESRNNNAKKIQEVFSKLYSDGYKLVTSNSGPSHAESGSIHRYVFEK